MRPTRRSPTIARWVASLGEEICDAAFEVIDLRVNPQLAAADQILAIPTVVRHLPAPLRKVIGDLSDTERVLVGLDIRPRIPS